MRRSASLAILSALAAAMPLLDPHDPLGRVVVDRDAEHMADADRMLAELAVPMTPSPLNRAERRKAKRKPRRF